MSVISPNLDRPAGSDADLNLSLRGYAPTQALLGLVDYNGPADAGAPQLWGLFADNRTPTLSAVYQVYDWNWSCNCRGSLIADPEVTLAGFSTTPGEIIRLPRSSYYIGSDYQALVLYADPGRIVLNYTREGNAIRGYTLYVEGIVVDAALLNLYQQTDRNSRRELPALRAGQALAHAGGNEIRVAIRDAGTFLDPRSRKDWWHGR